MQLRLSAFYSRGFNVLDRPNQRRPATPATYSLFGLWVSSWRADKMQAHLHERPRHPSESTEPCRPGRCGQRWPFISIFISFTLLFSFFTLPGRRKRIIGAHCKKRQGWRGILCAMKAYQLHFKIVSVNLLRQTPSIMWIVSGHLPLKNRNCLGVFLFWDFMIIPCERSFEVKPAEFKGTSCTKIPWSESDNSCYKTQALAKLVIFTEQGYEDTNAHKYTHTLSCT